MTKVLTFEKLVFYLFQIVRKYVFSGLKAKGFNYSTLKDHEPKLVQYLLTGLDDDNQDIRKDTIVRLSECGSSIQELTKDMESVPEDAVLST